MGAREKNIATMEAGLKKLETQEQKYSAELDKALSEYAELKAQAAELDPVELYAARQAIRPAHKKVAEQQLEDALQKKPSFSLLLSAKQETSRLLKEAICSRKPATGSTGSDSNSSVGRNPGRCRREIEYAHRQGGRHGFVSS